MKTLRANYTSGRQFFDEKDFDKVIKQAKSKKHGCISVETLIKDGDAKNPVHWIEVWPN